jgi:hypothetical protein
MTSQIATSKSQTCAYNTVLSCVDQPLTGSFQVRQMLNAILLESGLQISEESLEVIIDKVKKAGF